MSRARGLLTGLTVVAVTGCAQSSIDSDVSVQISQKNSSVQGNSFVLRATDPESGADLEIEEVSIEVKNAKGHYVRRKHRAGHASARLEVVLVADNSGSQKSVEQQVREASQAVGERLLGLGDYSRVGLVRVSSQVSVLSELTDDATQWDGAADGQFINNGWTALYDGVRTANELLTRSVPEEAEDPCDDPVFRGIVMFTNGADNNSADQHSDKVKGDGVDTSLEDLLSMSVAGDRAPMFTVGIGDRVDEATLRELADKSGGFYTEALDYDALEAALLSAARKFANAKMLCIPPGVAGCDGVLDSGKVLDVCGVCDGDGTSCLGCDGVANSGTGLDACGVCGGDASACAGCDGVANSGRMLDACGVCAGDGSSCAGCDGVANSGKVVDACGVCGGNGSSCAGCDGVANSGKVVDACGVCGGDGSSCNGGCTPGNGQAVGNPSNGNQGNDKCVGNSGDKDKDKGKKPVKKHRITVHVKTASGVVIIKQVEVEL